MESIGVLETIWAASRDRCAARDTVVNLRAEQKAWDDLANAKHAAKQCLRPGCRKTSLDRLCCDEHGG